MKNSQKKKILLIIATILLSIICIINSCFEYELTFIIYDNIIFRLIHSVLIVIPLIIGALGIFIPNEKELTSKELKKQRNLVITLAIIIFVINIIGVIIINADTFSFSYMVHQFLLSIYAFTSYILFFYAYSLKPKVNYSKVNKQELLDMKKKQQKYKRIWIIVLILCFLPFVYISLLGIIGTDFLNRTIYGFGAIALSLMTYVYVLTPLFVINAILITICIIKIRSNKKSIKMIDEQMGK